MARRSTEESESSEMGLLRPPIPTDLTATGVLAIGRRVPASSAPGIAEALARGGVRVFELTLNEPEGEALAAIEAAASLAKRASDSTLLVGAGTIRSISAAARALDAGAEFLVTPHCDPELIGWAAARGVPMIAGAFTATEILMAWRAGASAVKLFPASIVGPIILRELDGPFPDIPLVPTGGITLETTATFTAAGACAVGIGSWLMGDGTHAGIVERARLVISAVADARSGRSQKRAGDLGLNDRS